MTTANEATRRCEWAQGLAMQRAAGDLLTAEDHEALEDHRSHCPECRLMALSAEILADNGDGGIAPPLDDLAKRRLVNDVVERLASEEAQPRPKAAPRRRGYRVAAVAALLLCTGVGLAFGLHRLLRSPQSPASRAPTSPHTPTAQVRLISGQVQVDEAPADVGHAVIAGQTLRVATGRATLGLPGDAALLLESDSALHVEKLAAQTTTVRLQRGRLLASVRPRKGRPHFTVLTPAGRVEVTGTLFSVQHTPQGVTVAVLRGQVRVVEKGHPPRLVGRGMQTVMRSATGPITHTGRSGLQPMKPDALAEAWRRVRALELIGAGRAARVSLRSSPSGALVFVNGLLLGQTPLVTRMRAGHHQVVIRKVGHRAAEKLLHVTQGSDATWDVSLTSAFVTQLSPKPTVARLKPEPSTPSAGRRPAMRREPAANAVSAHPPKTPTVSPPTPNAKELALKARRLRAARNWRGAAKTFAELIRLHPRSGRARTARVSLGLILLDRLRNPRGALQQFSAYLASTRHGALAQEASYGRIRALRRLGRKKAEIRALSDFLRLYPSAIQVTNVRQRLKKLGVAPPPRPPRRRGLGVMGAPK